MAKKYVVILLLFALSFVAVFLCKPSGNHLLNVLPWLFFGVVLVYSFLVMGWEVYRGNIPPVEKEQPKIVVPTTGPVIDGIEFHVIWSSEEITEAKVGKRATVGWLALQNESGRVVLPPTAIDAAGFDPNFQMPGTCYVWYRLFSTEGRGQGDVRIIESWTGTALFVGRGVEPLKKELGERRV